MSVTAVPLQPLSKGSVLKLWIGILAVILIGVGLAWIGTAGQQYQTTESGVRYRVMETGEGDTVTPDDLVQIQFEVRDPQGELLTPPGGATESVTVNGPFPGLRDLILVMREGGIYQAFVPAQQAFGQPIPPGGRISSDDVLEFRVRVAGVLKGMAAMQQMMGPGGGGPGGPPMPQGPGGQ